MSGTKLARILAVTCITLFVAGLVFRALVYSKLYIAPNAPYGISDVIEFFLGSLLLLAFGISVLVAIVLAFRGPKANRAAAAWLVGSVGAMAVLLSPLHTLAAQWASR